MYFLFNILYEQLSYHRHPPLTSIIKDIGILLRRQMESLIEQQASQEQPQYTRISFETEAAQMKIKTLTHDYYIIELPLNHQDKFYKHFSFYLEQLDYKKKRIQISPVARIYGTNQFGQKCCCHLHGYYPHFYVKADEFSQAFQSNRDFLVNFLSLVQGLYQRAYSVNKPIIINGWAEKKIDFYGFHQKQQVFLKITVYDPSYIVKLRELLDSRIVAGRVFQCYQAHINYFMQLFSDHNIYGINELNVMGFTFRRNLSNDMMSLFKKMNTHTKNIFHEGIDLVEIHKKSPQLFNSVEKITTCYIQIDLSIHNILNVYDSQLQINESIDNNSVDSELSQIVNSLGPNKQKFQVKITRALKEIWEDQIKRREAYGMKNMPEGIIDYSKNIQARLSQENSDPLWCNFIKKGNNFQQMADMVKSSMLGQRKKQTDSIEVDREVAQNYKEVLQNQRQNLIEKVLGRWKYYGSRKQRILQQIMNGQKQQLPQWDDDKINEDGQQSNPEQQDEQQQQRDDENQSKSQFGKSKMKTPNNILLYRNNYKHLKPSLSKGSFFYICEFCKQMASFCSCGSCQITIFCQQKLQPQQLNLEVKGISISNHEQHQSRFKYRYKQKPPSIQQVAQNSMLKAQRPFYSNFKDLFSYYKINSQFQPCLKHAQILDRQLKIIKQYNREAVSIKNSQKVPYYFTFTNSQSQNNGKLILQQTNYRIKYQIGPPTREQITLEQTTSKFHIDVEQPQINRRSTSIKMSKDDTFVSDLVILHYQFIVGFESDCSRFVADPEKDEIVCFCIETRNFMQYRKSYKTLILIEKYVKKESLQVWEYDDIYFVINEYGLLSLIISIIFRLDPDLLVTYDQQKRGLRYLTQRGFAYGINFQSLISRSCDLDEIFQFINFRDFTAIKSVFMTKQLLLAGNVLQSKGKDNKNTTQLAYLQKKLKESLKRKPVLRQKYKFDIEVKGRVNVSLYRICEQQLKLESYTLQNVCQHLFNEQIPEFTDVDIFKFYAMAQGNKEKKMVNEKKSKLAGEDGVNFAIRYISKRIDLQAQIIVNMNIVSVLVEKSKVYGSDIVSMMERGSQFKIQAIMCRVTKKLGYLTLSASKRQVANQSVLQCIPLVLQPPKQFFTDPVLLFDFQSLYPSIMIAYNLCYSTCLGSINNVFDRQKLKRLGVCQKTNVDLTFLQELFTSCDSQEYKKRVQSSIFITPNKVAFVKKNIKEGIIPRILLQFLITRIMIKNSQGLYKKAKIKKVLKDRQYALKLFMNVLFGYTGASFTGRMPCSQIADSIVELAKYSLRQAIDRLNSHPKYKGKVLYGDTDSIFFQMPGYSINQSMKIGKQLALQITSMFPYPIQLKFQKVYDGLFLVAKKRYYGKMYQSQTSAPKYEGKGLQCVRRDGISLTRKLMRTMLNNLIDFKDLSYLKELFKEQSIQILSNQKLQNQFCLAKEVKLLKYSDKTCPAHGQAAKRLQKIDPMMAPKYGERMKYFVINGGLKAIKNRSISVFQYLRNNSMSVDLDYYFRKQVLPPIQRVLSSLADLNQWSSSVEHKHYFQFAQPHQLKINKKCYHCHGESHFILCQKCYEFAEDQISKINCLIQQTIAICKECTGSRGVAQANKCVQWNCSHLWNRRRVQKVHKNTYSDLVKLRNAIQELNF